MALTHSPKIVTDGLVFYSDAENKKSYDPLDQNNADKWKDITERTNSGIFSGASNYHDGNSSRFTVSRWTATTAPEANTWNAVTYGPERSIPPTTWTATSGTNYQWNAVTYGNGKFVAISRFGTNRVMYSSDAVSYTHLTLPTKRIV